MRGIVKDPVVATFAWELPEMVPVMALAKIEALAGPPRVPPVIAEARSLKKSEAFVDFKKLAKRINMKMYEAETMTATPRIPSEVIVIRTRILFRENPAWAKTPGAHGPT
jgi:hypothetical protein